MNTDKSEINYTVETEKGKKDSIGRNEWTDLEMV